MNQGVNPTWDKLGSQDFSFTVSESDTILSAYLSVKILGENKYFAYSPIGEAKIPLKSLRDSPTNNVTAYPLVTSTSGCFRPSVNQGTVSLTITVGPMVETPDPWYVDYMRRCGTTTSSSGGSDVLTGMALGYAMG